MPAARLRLAIPLSAFAIVAIVVAALGVARDVDRGHDTVRLAGAQRPAGLPVSGFALRDERGRVVRLAAFRGRPLALMFVSTRCADCPLVAQQVRGALDATPGAAAAAVSVDPRADSPSRVRRFLATQRLKGRVPYLAGPRAALRRVWRAYGAAPGRPVVVVLDPRGRQRVGFTAGDLAVDDLAHDLRALR
jgi:cytochrome oxidase Cu insertion factor (SCO1/SenC/PrrC family)